MYQPEANAWLKSGGQDLFLPLSQRTSDPRLTTPGLRELADAIWVSKDQLRAGEVVALPPPVSIAHRIITDWLDS